MGVALADFDFRSAIWPWLGGVPRFAASRLYGWPFSPLSACVGIAEMIPVRGRRKLRGPTPYDLPKLPEMQVFCVP
jgi:hypothetical protein